MHNQPRLNKYFTLSLLLMISYSHSNTLHAGLSQNEGKDKEVVTAKQPPLMQAITIPQAIIIKHVIGYHGNQFVQGEVAISDPAKNIIEGYLYIKSSKQYIYGEIHQNIISAYDNNGNHYLLTFEQP